MRKSLIAAVLLCAFTLSANPALFGRYEAVRQGLLAGSLDRVKASAQQLAADARKAKQADVAKQAELVAKSADLDKARTAFGALSDAMIQVRAKATGARPAVYFCPMANRSWLQAKGTAGNPYEPAMQTCGTLKAE